MNAWALTPSLAVMVTGPFQVASGWMMEALKAGLLTRSQVPLLRTKIVSVEIRLRPAFLIWLTL
jgi:hypothetical protein